MSIEVRHWADWLANTALSNWFQRQLWVIPTPQSIHILGVSVLFGCALSIARWAGVIVFGRWIGFTT